MELQVRGRWRLADFSHGSVQSWEIVKFPSLGQQRSQKRTQFLLPSPDWNQRSCLGSNLHLSVEKAGTESLGGVPRWEPRRRKRIGVVLGGSWGYMTSWGRDSRRTFLAQGKRGAGCLEDYSGSCVEDEKGVAPSPAMLPGYTHGCVGRPATPDVGQKKTDRMESPICQMATMCCCLNPLFLLVLATVQ